MKIQNAPRFLPRLLKMSALLIPLMGMTTLLHAGVTTKTITFKSQALDAVTTYVAALPDPLEPNHKYPVLYLLHGATGSYADWSTKTTVTQLLDGRDMIIVMPDGSAFGWYIDSKLKPQSQYDTAVSRDVVRDVEQRFPVRTDRAGRGICGLSMGGHGALSLAAKHPEEYGSASSLSGILDITDHPKNWQLPLILGDQNTSLQDWKANSVYYLANRFTTANVALLFDTGTADKTGAVRDNRRLDEKLTNLDVPHIYREFPGAHTWSYWSEHIPEHLDFHQAVFDGKDPLKQ